LKEEWTCQLMGGGVDVLIEKAYELVLDEYISNGHVHVANRMLAKDGIMRCMHLPYSVHIERLDVACCCTCEFGNIIIDELTVS